ncbi:major facilitator superfamily transporter multidrug resistance [Ophiostoma piceae UAMH 11346]|uniref:Major facilitator superfamily transporter multidrug resistance n=1 Tax=Ophiostoma piceae (strain UAMH 11346) TaxID=1262450 RepID=S3CD43_OPHP1|nr:major facilitator superfamily transporter multidrug resistance [Ophiostoma piceae UAMH 11346]
MALPNDNEKTAGYPGPVDAVPTATPSVSLSGSSARSAKSHADDTTKEKRTEASIDDTDDASLEDEGPYGVSEIEQTDDLSSAEKGTADDGSRQEPHHHGHNSLAATISRIASNASSTLRRRHLEHHKKLDHIDPTKIPVSNLDLGIVGWESEADPAMPLNFSPRRKWTIITFLASMTLMTPFASSILAPGITMMDDEFHNDSLTLGSLAVSIYLLGYAVGPLLLAGLSELYGRHIVLNISNAFFCVWQIGCALAPSLNSLIVFRFFAGIGGSACMTLGGACISDLFPIEERGLALSLWTIGPLVGPSVGPIAGAWIAQTIGWRWDFWIVLIPGAINTIVMAVFSTETSHQVLIRRKVNRLAKELGRDDLRSCYEDPNKPRAPTRQLLLQGLVRPLKLLFKSPVLFVISLYIAFAYGVLYLLFNTIPMVFQDGYGWSTGITGLVYIPMGLGYCAGLVVFARVSDRTVVRLTKNNGGVYEPEMRLVDCVYFACCLPITFFWYGWSADKQVHWIVPVLGLFPYGFAVLGIWQPAQAFVIDGYGQYAASAIAAFTVFRSVVAAFLPLAGPPMYASLGIGWGNSLLGFICIALIPVPLFLYRYGAILRKKYPLVL